jgi:hypothetical protein
MNLVRTVLKELLGLFLDDEFLAMAILVVVGLTALVVLETDWGTGTAEALLIGGCLGVLSIGVMRTVCAASRR